MSGRLRAEGRRLALADAVAEALTDEPEEPWRVGPRSRADPTRDRGRAAGGRGAEQPGDRGRLFLSVRTVDVHVDRVLTKLGFRSRGQLTAWAHEQGLVPRDT